MNTRKIYYFSGLLLLTLLGFSCKTKQVPSTSQVTFIRQSLPGTVTLSALGYGDNKAEAETDAFRTAISTICYRGLPGVNDLQRAWFDDSSTENSSYWASFYQDRKYLTFITSQEAATTHQQAKSSMKLAKVAVEKEMTINYKSLRQQLENDGMLRVAFSY